MLPRRSPVSWWSAETARSRRAQARLTERLAQVHTLPLEELLSELVAHLLPQNADDDVAIVAVCAFREDKPRPPEEGPENVPVDVPDHL